MSDFTINADLSLLRVRRTVVSLAAKEHGQRWNRSGVGNRDAKLGQVGRRDARGLTGRRCAGINFALGKQRLENAGGREGRIGRRTSQRDEDLSDLPDTVNQAERLHHIANLSVNWRIEDSVARTDHSLLVIKRIPGKAHAWCKVVVGRVQNAGLLVDFIPNT